MRAHGRETTKRIGIVFLESIIVTPTLLFANMRAKVRASPDFYRHAGDEAAAMADLRERIGHYEASYESLSEAEGCAYIKVRGRSRARRGLPCARRRLSGPRRARSRPRATRDPRDFAARALPARPSPFGSFTT